VSEESRGGGKKEAGKPQINAFWPVFPKFGIATETEKRLTRENIPAKLGIDGFI